MLEVRQLLPVARGEVDPLDVHGAIERPAPADRPWVLSDFVTSLDGAVTVDGVSAGLGSPGDRRVFGALRAVADVIVVGAGTVRAEHYGPCRLDADRRAWRRERGMTEVPPIVVVTRSLRLDLSTPLFTEATARTVVLTCDAAPADLRRAAGEMAEVMVAGDDRVDLAAGLAALAERGHRVALTEGGPSLHGDLLVAGLLDEVCLTGAPLVTGRGDAGRSLFGGREPAQAVPLELTHLLEEDGYLFARYVVGD